MAIDRQSVSRWLESYVQAWHSYDPQAIGALFSEDASYAWHPWDEGDDVARGRDAIVRAWTGDKDPPGTYEAEYAPIAVDGDVAVASGRSRYYKAGGALDREYDNVFVMRFDADGRCSAFTEWFMQRPRS